MASRPGTYRKALKTEQNRGFAGFLTVENKQQKNQIEEKIYYIQRETIL